MNIMSAWYLESANHCSGPFNPDQNEMELAGLTSIPSEVVNAPRVAEAAVQLECEVIHMGTLYLLVSFITATVQRN